MVFCNLILGAGAMVIICHNPYFNRWFSAISNTKIVAKKDIKSQSLF